MAQKNISDLTAENISVIASQTSPESITESTLADFIQDIIDSYWNKIDGITVGTVGNPLTIPPLFNGLINIYGDQLQDIIQSILDTTSIVSGMTQATQGQPGQFATKTVEPSAFDIATLGTAVPLLLLNDYENGYFDNGNNWNGSRYTAGANGFSGKFMVSDMELELIDTTMGSGDAIVSQILVKHYNSSNVLQATIITTNIGTYNDTSVIGDKRYGSPSVSAAISMVNGDYVTIELKGSLTNSPSGTVSLNSCVLSNTI